MMSIASLRKENNFTGYAEIAFYKLQNWFLFTTTRSNDTLLITFQNT